MNNVVVVGYGNVGKKVVQAVLDAPDMNLVGIKVLQEADAPCLEAPVVTSLEQIDEKIDVAILCVPSRMVPQLAAQVLEKGIHTVDSFDIHPDIPKVRGQLSKQAKQSGAVSVLSAGWDPGSDSVVRTLMQAMVPSGVTYTNFGPGMSMGHSVAVKAISGVVDAISMTIPVGAGVHRRMVYVQLEPEAVFLKVEQAVKSDPYFIHDDTHVIQVEDISQIRNAGHGVDLQRLGMSSGCANQRLSFGMTIDGPAVTAQVMVSCARAATRLQPGCYTMVEIPPVDFLPGEKEDWITKLV